MIAPGDRLGAFEIVGKLGEGGMGEVYRARDPRLRREVAVKVLPTAVAHDADRLARFEREAQLLAQLHHPNIASIFGLEESEGVYALVMELVEGPTLAERLEAGALPLEDSLSIARQIAEALEEAHEKGIVHRDLKPQNVKVTGDGRVKVLDFGLAKALDPTAAASGAASASQLAASPTLTLEATVQGVILGTAAYMAPEQAAGGVADRRADIWSFGVVLYEMLSGRRLFEGESVTHVLAGVLKDEPDFTALPPETPERIRRLVRRCLRKKPRERLQSIGDARVVIDEVLAEPDRGAPAVSGGRPGTARSPGVAWALAAAGFAASLLFASLWLRGALAPERSLHAALAAPAGSRLGDSFALSPDGGRLAFQVFDAEDRVALWLNDLETGENRRLPGTEGGELPFWSPDGRHLGFFAEGLLRRLDLRSGSSRTLGEAPTPRGGSWGEDGRIVFAPAFRAGLWTVPSSGGEAQPLTQLDDARGEKSHRWPVFLPGGRRLLFLAQTAEGGARDDRSSIDMLDVATGARSTIVFANSSPILASNGYLLFWREGALFAQRFDAGRGALSGEPAIVASSVGYDINERAIAAVAGDAALVYQAGGRGTTGTLGITDRRGIDTAGLREYEQFDPRGLAFSRDGLRLVYGMNGEGQGSPDLWVHDFDLGTPRRLTFEEGSEFAPVWAPDDRTIYYAIDRDNDGTVYRRAADGSGAVERVGTTPAGMIPFSIGPDGTWLVIGTARGATGEDILRYDLATGEVEPLVETAAQDWEARLSPDGRLLAFVSGQSGRSEVYVQAIAGARGRWQVSTGGGTMPRWRPEDGRELYFVAPPDRLMAVPVDPGTGTEAAPRFGTPVELFRKSMANYDPAPDGQSFAELLVTGAGDRPLTLVTRWTAGLPRGAE